MYAEYSRRTFLRTAAAGVGLTALASPTPAEVCKPRSGNFRFALNTGTIRGYNLSLAEQVNLTASAGYTGIEPWTSDIAKASETPGALKDIRKRCTDSGLSIISAIGFANWAGNDDTERVKGLEQMKRDMHLVAQLGGTHIAASPAGVNKPGVTLDLDQAAERYRTVLELGRTMGIIPQLEFWGASANLNRLDQCLYVAARTAHPDACILADAFHMYKGGTEPAALRLLGRSSSYCFHMNDYPAQPAREVLKDSDRIWPGDGIAPLREILNIFLENRAEVWLSVELFNPMYWKQPANETASTGLAKMKAVVKSAEVT
ncbi:MAG: hypothetical protein A2283_10980 [Lentisphaerae bacterium RIFOXYA12_FULL_48_11]|nr:MAG: hypothetical protein A2283_10980 [Lentisphaerae bacterium RIFOXYA12_FULL_48_11]